MSGGGGEEGGDKSFEPTQRRLEDARKRGEAPRSADLTTAAAYGGALLAATAFGGASLMALGAGLAPLLGDAARLSEAAFADGGAALWGGVLGRATASVWPWFALPAAAALLGVLAQGGVVVAPQKVAPQASRVSPLASAKQKFGVEGLVEFAKGLAKLGVLGAVLGAWLWAATPRLVALAALAPGPATLSMLDLTLGLLARVAVLALAFGLLDLLWQRLSFLRRHRMTRKELTDEMRDSEGDPHVKAQRRARAQAIAANRMLADVAEASVVIVNPTHYAVALRWDRGRGGAPTCVAKGVDEVAARIRERAAEAGVPIRRDPPTARALHAALKVGQEVGRDDWRAVAAAIRFAEGVRAREARRRRGPPGASR